MPSDRPLFNGIAATLGVLAFALLVSTSVSPQWLGGWGSLFLNAMVPAQVVISLLWGCSYPKWAASLPQPLRGLVFTAMTVGVGLIIGGVSLFAVGGGVMPPTPFVIMFLILAVPVTIWLVVPLQTWPLSLIFKEPGSLGIAVVATAYAITYLLYRVLFNFGFAMDAPFYLAALDPGGALMAWIPLVASLASLVVILILVLLDFWPVTALARRYPILLKQPFFGLACGMLITIVAGLAGWLFIGIGGMDLIVFMTRVCVPEIFGIFIILVMLEGVPHLKLVQPWRGLVLTVIASGLSVLMFALYRAVAIARFGLAAGQPDHALELWLASSMLGVTFPAMVTFGAYFQFWPYRAGPADAAQR